MLESITLHRPYQTKQEYVYEILRSAILTGELKSGAKLVIDHLASELNVSTIPIRGALQRLQSEGLVEITPHTGAIVSKISPDMIDELFMLLAHLEEIAFSVASRKARQADLDTLQSLVEDMDRAIQQRDTRQWSELNHIFHYTIAGISGMELLIEFTSRTLNSWDRVRRCYLEGIDASRLDLAQAEHAKMVNLLKLRDVDGLVTLIRQHNQRAHEDYCKLLNFIEPC
jgi:DNA-binding GntR family transcriptional regulator